MRPPSVAPPDHLANTIRYVSSGHRSARQTGLHTRYWYTATFPPGSTIGQTRTSRSGSVARWGLHLAFRRLRPS
eukprot:3489495-Rhodomonas_salina.1